jgi:cyclic pyranopterin phosphate synthase
MKDRQGRNIEYLRVSVTDSCNLRCLYCMPETGAVAAAQGELLTFDEIRRVVGAMARLGVHGLRLTGGEPMARPGCLELVGQLKRVPGIRRVAMTTNGILLRGRVAEAAEAGLDALNLSIDALNPDLYRRMTRGGDVSEVLATLDEALTLGLEVRLNAVTVCGLNEGELEPLAALAERLPVDVRFIELMPIGPARELNPYQQPLPLSSLSPIAGKPAKKNRPQLQVIAPISAPFCSQCNRIRVTADEQVKPCLHSREELSLRGLSGDELVDALRAAILAKPAGHNLASGASESARDMSRIGG